MTATGPVGGGTLEGWGRMPVVPGREILSEDLRRITIDVPLTRGLGRAYGDSALPAAGDHAVAGTALADRIVAFDPATAVLTVEAGFSLEQLYRIFLPRGYFTPVTPGTRFVTVGGMVASDVHGKNHHRAGCFGEHVASITLRLADGSIITCSRAHEGELFRATLGGMGLTGHILEVSVRLERVPSPWILQETTRIADIDHFIDALKSSGTTWPMTVGWIDCVSRGRAMGRGVLFRGRWATAEEAPPKFPLLSRTIPVPFTLPHGVLGSFVARAFNEVYFRRHSAGVSRGVVHPSSFFYPLDGIGRWNRLYGPRGFTQYQCVLPESAGRASARRLLDLITQRGAASFLCVIKDCGAEGTGMLSFPKPGISIALDIPMRRGTQALVDRMNELVIEEGGRVYLAKDALTRPEHFRRMESRLDAFLEVRRRWDPEGRLRSAQSIRLFGW